jgi:chromosome segregation ATPase
MNRILLVGILAGIAAILHNQRKQSKQSKMGNEEVLAKLTSANAKVDKVITEVQALKDLVNTTPAVPQPIVDAVNALESKLQQLDDLNEDAPTTEEPPVEDPAV